MPVPSSRFDVGSELKCERNKAESGFLWNKPLNVQTDHLMVSNRRYPWTADRLEALPLFFGAEKSFSDFSRIMRGERECQTLTD